MCTFAKDKLWNLQANRTVHFFQDTANHMCSGRDQGRAHHTPKPPEVMIWLQVQPSRSVWKKMYVGEICLDIWEKKESRKQRGNINISNI